MELNIKATLSTDEIKKAILEYARTVMPRIDGYDVVLENFNYYRDIEISMVKIAETEHADD